MSTTVTHANWDALNNAEFHQRFEDAFARQLEAEPGRHPILIGGRFTTRTGGTTVRSPGDPSVVLGTVVETNPEETDSAVTAARDAFRGWAKTPFIERVAAFRALAKLIDRDRFDLAALLSMEIGKNRFEAMTEVEEAVALIDFYAGQVEVHAGYEHAYPPLGNERSVSAMRPYGVWGVLGPANFPFALVVGMTMAAVVCGNTAVVKPPEDAPLPAVRFAELTVEADFPPGVVNVVTGGAETGAALVGHPDVAGIAFTGSARVGRLIADSLSPQGKPVVAEMGGKNPAIVTASADLTVATRGIARSAFRYSGQKCSACSRVFASSEVVDELVDGIVNEWPALTIGVPWQRETAVGSLISHRAVDRYREVVRDAGSDARRLYVDELPCGLPKGGAYVPPVLAVGLSSGHRILCEELFLPVLAVQAVDSFDEALRGANATAFGLSAGIYSGDQAELERFFDEIEAGVVYANRAAGATTGAWVGHQSFGGWKASGVTGKNAHGPHYLPLFMREQSRTYMDPQ